MKKALIVSLSALMTIILFETPLKAQKFSDEYYALDNDFRVIENVKKATHLLRVKKFSDSSWRMDIYNFMGPMLQSVSYKDREGTIKNGKKYLYNDRGVLMQEENYKDGQLNGSSYFRNDTGKVILQKDYEQGVLVKTKDFLKDSLLQKKTDTTTNPADKMADFEGGLEKWRTYLTKNFIYPKRANDSNIEGTVFIEFIINKEGMVEEPHVYKSVELSLDDETLRLIVKAPKWVPSFQNGKNVKAYFRQPVAFRLY